MITVTTLCLAVKAAELLVTAETKASAAADVIATKTVEAKDATVAAAHTAAATVQGNIGSLLFPRDISIDS